MSLRALQEDIKDKRKPLNTSLLPLIERRKQSTSESTITDDLYVTAKLGMKLKLLNPNEVLVDAIDGVLDTGLNATELIGLSLRLGADPNLYIKVTEEQHNTNFHVLYYVWRKIPKNKFEMEELYGMECDEIEKNVGTDVETLIDQYLVLMENIFAMLLIAGSDVNMPAVNLQANIGQTGNIGQVETVRQIGVRLKSVEYNIYKEGSIDNKLTEEARVAFDTFKTYSNIGNKMMDYVDVDDIVRDMVVLLDASEALSVDSPSTSNCITGHANKCLEKALNMRRFSAEDGERYLEEAMDSYNVMAVVMIIERGVIPRYNLVDRLILASGKNLMNFNRPLNSALQNRMMIEMARRGVGFDKPQIELVASFSPKTALMLEEIQTEPYWRRTCRVEGGITRPELKNLAREIGVNPGGDKKDICMELTTIDKVPETKLENLAAKLQRKRLEARKTNIGDLVTGRTQKAKEVNVSEKICVNEALLLRDRNGKVRKPEDFADLDIVLTESDGKTYCFTSEDYDSLLESNINPFTGKSLTSATVNEIKAKKSTLEESNLPLSSIGSYETIKKIKSTKEADSYDAWTRQRSIDFLILASNTYDMKSDIFTQQLSNSELEYIATNVSGIEGTTFDINSKQRSLRSFGNTMMELIDMAPSQESVDRLFADIGDVVNQILEAK